MSTNVIKWSTKELVNLKIPVDSLFKHPRKDWHPEVSFASPTDVTYAIAEGSFIRGIFENGILVVSEINARGEGSGTALDWVIEPALKDSTGVLVATRVWEDGSVDKLISLNGQITKQDIPV